MRPFWTQNPQNSQWQASSGDMKGVRGVSRPGGSSCQLENHLAPHEVSFNVDVGTQASGAETGRHAEPGNPRILELD